MSFYQAKQWVQNLISGNKYLAFISRLPKTHLLATIAILFAIPLTVILSGQQQNLRKEASEKSSVKAATSKPNIVIIMLDDVNPIDGRFFTQERTPAIYNNIVGKGINFTNFYGETSLCCPGRVGYLTGQHTQNHNVNDLDGTKFNPNVTIATELSSKGYYTMLTGKYVNNYLEIPRSKAIPPGWSKFDAIYANNGKYYKYNMISKNGDLTHYGETPADYSTDVITNIALKRLKEAPANKPIFAILNPYAIHAPHIQAPRHVGDSRCANIDAWNAPNVHEADVSDKAEYIRDLPQGESSGYSLKTQCEMLLSVDDMVKKVKSELVRQGRLNNTLFILTADNGYSFKEHRLPAKTVPYATHLPLYISWPAARGSSPKVVDTILSNIDLAPTLCELAGCAMGPYPNGQLTPDGISFLSLIKNQVVSLGRDAILESQPIVPIGAGPSTRPAWWAIRTTAENPLGLWHYIEYATGERELYDMSNGPCYLWSVEKTGDPCELENLLRSDKTPSSQAEDIAVKLKARLTQLKNEKGFVPPSLSPTPTITPSPTPAPVALAPKGYHDSATCSVLTGWTCDPNDNKQTLKVHFYKDGPAGGGGTMIGETIADKIREQAVDKQCGGNANHGFTFTTPDTIKDGLSHQIYAYAINIGPEGINPLLLNSPKTLSCPASASSPNAASVSQTPNQDEALLE